MTKQGGFTLLEALVTVSVLMIISILLTQVFVTTIRTNTKSEISKEVKQNGEFALDVMSRMILNAHDVSSECLDTGTTGSSVSIINIDGGTTTFECKSDSGVLRIASTSATTTYLTGPNVTLSGADCTSALTLTCSLLPLAKKSVGITFTLIQKGTQPKNYEQASELFKTSVTLRN